MTPIECGGVRAKENQTRRFTHIDEEDVYEIELTGYKEGGHIYKEIYWNDGHRKRYISGWGYDVDKGEEKEDSSTGLIIKGT
jgi:hypothetical protein